VDADDAVSRQLASARQALDDALPRIVERLVEMGARLVAARVVPDAEAFSEACF
jgi:flagellar hook-length control protein FliK